LTDTPITSSYRLLDAQEVAALLNVSASWVRDHSTRRQPRLPVVRLGSLLRYRREDLLAWIDEMRDLAA
jgi:predicted DNA-binding transcriptional regulator AlpA